MANVGFFTPIRCVGEGIPLEYKLREWADSYFYLGGRVAVLTPEGLESKTFFMMDGKANLLTSALKIASYLSVFAIFFPRQVPPIARPILLSKAAELLATASLVTVTISLVLKSFYECKSTLDNFKGSYSFGDNTYAKLKPELGQANWMTLALKIASFLPIVALRFSWHQGLSVASQPKYISKTVILLSYSAICYVYLFLIKIMGSMSRYLKEDTSISDFLKKNPHSHETTQDLINNPKKIESLIKGGFLDLN